MSNTKTIFPKKDKTKCKMILNPCDIIINNTINTTTTIEISIHQCSKSYIKECEYVYPNINLNNLIAIPTMQKTINDLVSIGPTIEQEKDISLENFFLFSKDICNIIISKGYWADYIDPCSGLAMITTNANKPFNEVASAEMLLGYSVVNTGCCKVLLHPSWGSHVYPATMHTTAPPDLIMSLLTPKLVKPIDLIAGIIDIFTLSKLQDIEEEMFINLHPKSKEYHETASAHLLGGVPMCWMTRLPGSFPLLVNKAQGAHFIDTDGIEYVDYCLGDTGAMTGHAVPAICDAISERSKLGITTMMPSSDAAWVADELSRRFGLPYWQMAMTATDANRFVLRYCRHLTRRPKIAVMDWCYHGSVDEALAVLGEDGTVQPRPGAIGPQIPVAKTTRVVQFNDIDHLEEVLQHGDVACLLMEPALTNIGIVLPDEGYLTKVREMTRKYGVLLIIDETHTICTSPGGCTAAWGLEPDFLVIGKPIAGGFPAAAYGMSAEVGERLRTHLGADDIDVSGVGGTLTGNALAMAAVRATLSSTLREEDYEKTIPLATKWADGVKQVITDYNLPWTVQQLGCRSEYWFCPAPKNGLEAAKNTFHELETYMHLFALNRGILLTPFHNMALFSPFHTIDDVEKHNEVFREAVITMLTSMNKL